MQVTPGYYKDAEKTKSEFDEEGFFHSGDIGTITPQGALKIVDRKKNIFKLAQGEYIAVEQLESQFSRNEAVEMIWVYGNSHESSLVAVVVPKESWLQKYSGAEDEMARRDMLKELERTGKEAKLKGFELIKAVHLEPNVFTVEDDLITPSMKLKRPQLQRKYQQVIDDMYAQLKTSNRRR
jgi:long-chain acyl-CoA synthetase